MGAIDHRGYFPLAYNGKFWEGARAGRGGSKIEKNNFKYFSLLFHQKKECQSTQGGWLFWENQILIDPTVHFENGSMVTHIPVQVSLSEHEALPGLAGSDPVCSAPVYAGSLGFHRDESTRQTPTNSTIQLHLLHVYDTMAWSTLAQHFWYN